MLLSRKFIKKIKMSHVVKKYRHVTQRGVTFEWVKRKVAINENQNDPWSVY